MPATYDITINKGNTFTLDVTFTDGAGAPLALAGSSFQPRVFVAGNEANPIAVLSVADTGANKRRFTLSTAQTAVLFDGRYRWELGWTDANGEPWDLLHGGATVSAGQRGAVVDGLTLAVASTAVSVSLVVADPAVSAHLSAADPHPSKAPVASPVFSGVVGIGAVPPSYVDRLYIMGTGDTVREPVVIDTPAGQIVDILTARVGGVVKFDITSTGSIELNAITFLRSPDDVAANGVGGGGGEISEKVGQAMLFLNGPASNGNQVFNALAAGSHHFQYGGVTKRYMDTNGITFNNAQTLYWKDTGGFQKEVLRGAGDNSTALAALGTGGVKVWSAGFGAVLANFLPTDLDTQTGLELRVRRTSTTITQERVLIGPVDSAGAGFRALRVAN